MAFISLPRARQIKTGVAGTRDRHSHRPNSKNGFHLSTARPAIQNGKDHPLDSNENPQVQTRKMDFISLPRAQQFKTGRTIPWIQTKTLKFKLEKMAFISLPRVAETKSAARDAASSV
jgi:hypothetical protein